MKFVFFGYDLMLPIVQDLVAQGHTLVGVMSFPCDQVFNFNTNCQALARECGASYVESPACDVHIESFLGKDVQLFLSAGYPHKIPSIDEEKAYALNIHPSYLPYGRGIMPVPHILLGRVQEAAGYSIHKLTQDFDAGDIVFQERIDIDEAESVERYCAKILSRIRPQMVNLINSLDGFLSQAKEQDESLATHYSMPSAQMRTLDFEQPVAKLLQISRAFGRYGCFAHLSGHLLNVFACDGWEENHDYQIGTCLTLQNNLAVIAVSDGFLAFKEFRVEG